MSCPTCDGAMAALGYADGGTIWHCERCGTVKHHDQFTDAPPKVYVPKLVDRCREHAVFRLFLEMPGLGISESINLPADRPKE